MSIDEGLADRVRAALSDRGVEWEERRMFGALVFMVDAAIALGVRGAGACSCGVTRTRALRCWGRSVRSVPGRRGWVSGTSGSVRPCVVDRQRGQGVTGPGVPPVMRTSSSKLVGNTVLACPAAAHTRSYRARSVSTTVLIRCG